ncbi:MAG: hypothetical protein RH917_17690 [Lacipirellulaceae bacterium]
MNDPREAKLDQALQMWADSTEASDEQLAELQDSFRTSMRKHIVQPLAVTEPTTQSRHLAAMLAIAAALLISLVTWKTFNAQRVEPRNHGDQLTDSLDSVRKEAGQDEKRDQRLMFVLNACRELYGSQIAWIFEGDSSFEVGLAPSDSSSRDRYVAIQLRLTIPSKSHGPSEVVHAIELVMGQDQVVELRGAAGGRNLSAWVHPVDQEMVAIEIRCLPDLTGFRGPLEELEASHLQRLGSTILIHKFSHEGVEYQLHQTANLIDLDSTDTGELG